MATYPVKYLHSAMRGAPVISSVAGAITTALDACLLNGFGSVTVTSISVSGGVATATVNSGDWFEDASIVLIDGATPATLNGEQRVLSHTSVTFTFATDAPDGAATGTITAKYAPAPSWSKAFGSDSKAVYRSDDLSGSRFFYRIDDSNTDYATVGGYESMADVDTGSMPFPAAGAVTRWWKKNSYAGGNRAWRLFADSRFVYLLIEVGKTRLAWSFYPALGFGDAVPINIADDAFASLVAYSDNSATNMLARVLYGNSTNIPVARASHGLGGTINAAVIPVGGGGSLTGDDDTLGAFPRASDGALLMARVCMTETTTNRTPRAWIPGIYHIPQSGVSAQLTDGSVVAAMGALAGRRLVLNTTFNKALTSVSPTPTNIYAIDSTGPWR